MSFKIYTKPLTALAVMAFLSGPAFAEHGPADGPHGGKPPREGRMIPMNADEVSKIEKMKPEERDAYFKKKKEEFKAMSPEEKKALRDKRKAWFDSLSQEEKDSLKERNKKLREEFKERKKAEFEKMTPEEKQKFQEERKERREKMKDGDHPKPPKGEHPPKPPEDADEGE